MTYPPSGSRTRLVVDGHAHLRESSFARALDAANENFARVAPPDAWSAVLCLVEPAGQDLFAMWSRGAANGALALGSRCSTWRARRTREEESLALERENGRSLALIAGRQVISAERLEVLAIGTSRAFAEGTPAGRLVDQIQRADALAVLPWGAGKWLGARGRSLRDLIRDSEEGSLYLGDNGGRPTLWRPSHFKLARSAGIPILPGSDPLPFSGEAVRLGSFGFTTLADRFDPETPAAGLKDALRSGSTPVPYGRSMGAGRFLSNQVRLLSR